MNRYRKLFSDTVILGVGTFASKLLVFLLMPLYTAYLSTAQFGTAELITSTANLLIPLACVGISNGIFRFAAEKHADQAAVFSSSLTLLGGGTAIFLLLSPILFCVPYFDGYVWLIPLYVILANLQSVLAQYVRATDRTKLFAFQGILNTVLTVGLNVLFLAAWDMGVTGYVLSVILGNLITSAFLAITARLWRVFSVSKIDRALMKELLRFSLPLIPTTVCWLITDLSDRYLVTHFCGEAVNGIYSAAYKIPTIVNLLSAIFMQAWQFSAIAQSSDGESCKHFYSQVFGGFISLIFLGASGLILLSEVFTGLLFNVTYAGAAKFMPTLLCAAALEAVVSFLATVYMVKKRSMNSFYTAMAGTLLNVVLNLILIPKFGALGAAIATLASYGLVFVLRLLDAPRLIRFQLYLPRLFTNVALLLLLAVVMTARPTGWLWMAILLTAITVWINALPLIRNVRQAIQKR